MASSSPGDDPAAAAARAAPASAGATAGGARPPFRSATVRQQFDRRAASWSRHDVLPREVARRLDERLDPIRIAPRCIVEVGCGRGDDRALLAARFPAAQWVGVDASAAMLAAGEPARARGWRRLLAGLRPAHARRAPAGAVCAWADALPLPDGSADLVWSNLMAHWHPQPHRLFPEWRRVLRPQGLVAFTAFGPDTLLELRAAVAQVLPGARPLPYVDMHDFGDMLMAAGFAAPVVESERIVLAYPGAASLLREVRALGGNPRDDRPCGLPGGRRARELLAALEATRTAEGRIALRFEVIYAHAWVPEAGPAVRDVRIPVDRLRAQLRGR